MSKTPRTDNAIITDNEYLMENIGLVDFVRASHARQLETELADKDKQLAEARAEIERLKSEHEDSLRRAKNNAVSLSGAVTEYAGELLVKDKLIEQMREALEIALDCVKEIHGEESRDYTEIKAALASMRPVQVAPQLQDAGRPQSSNPVRLAVATSDV